MESIFSFKGSHGACSCLFISIPNSFSLLGLCYFVGIFFMFCIVECVVLVVNIALFGNFVFSKTVNEIHLKLIEILQRIGLKLKELRPKASF